MSNSIAEKLHQAFDRFNARDLAMAERLCNEILSSEPQDPDALHLLGTIALQNGKPAAAVESLQKAAAIRPDHPAYQANIAYAYVSLKRYQEALTAFERAVRLAPEDPELWLGMGNCLAILGKAAQAEETLRRLVVRHPGYALGWFNLANALRDQERDDEALELYGRVTQLAPRFAEAYWNLGIVLHKLERFGEAEKVLRTCLALEPNFIPACLSLAITLNGLRRHAESEALCREALRREPREKSAWPILGRALAGQGRWREALRCFEQAATEYPDSSDAFGNLGDALARIGKVKDALAAFDRAYALGNVSSFVHLFKATTLFSVGRIAEGAVAFLGRHERSTFVERHPDTPLAWDLPHDLQGQEVCLLGERRVGDEFFFLRYAPRLKALGCRIIYFGNPAVTGILARSPALDRVQAHADSYPAMGTTILAGDLLHLLGDLESSPLEPSGPVQGASARAFESGARFPWHCRVYWPELPPPLALSPLRERVALAKIRLRQLGPSPYVGFTWRAGSGPQGERGQVLFPFREIPLENLASALQGVRGTLVSLQRGPRPGETERLAALLGNKVHDLSLASEDLEEMLALLAVLDEYIGVGSTNVHLRAGVGRAARVLVPWPPDWRWLTVGDESPWFPGFTIYRQKPNGDWSAAVERLVRDTEVSIAGGTSSAITAGEHLRD